MMISSRITHTINFRRWNCTSHMRHMNVPIQRSPQLFLLLLILVVVVVALQQLDDDTSFSVDAWTKATVNSRHSSRSWMRKVYSCRFLCIKSRSTNLHSTTVPNTSADVVDSTITQQPLQRPLCFYRPPIDTDKNSNNRLSMWKPRIDIVDLMVGQELQGVIVQEKLSNTKTGPKVWVDVGVCRWSTKTKPYHRKNTTTTTTNNNTMTTSTASISSSSKLIPTGGGGWKICTGLLRLGNSYVKESVVRKRVSRLRNKPYITVYVSRIYIEEGRFDVTIEPPDENSVATATAAVDTSTLPPKKSASNLQVGDVVTGIVTRIVDYGVFVQLDEYNNRNGLLHIKQVADLYQTYIDKKQGLIDAGLDYTSRVQLQVIEKDSSKRIFLDFTNEVKQIAVEEQRQEREETERQQNQLRMQLQQQREKSSSTTLTSETVMSASAAADDNDEAVEAATDDVPNGSLEFANISGTAVIDTTVEDGIVVENDTDETVDEMEYDEEEEEYDNYDEERAIEDALGLGMY